MANKEECMKEKAIILHKPRSKNQLGHTAKRGDSVYSPTCVLLHEEISIS